MRRLFIALAVTLCLPLLGGACSEETVVLASVSSAGSVAVGSKCVHTSDCETGAFCDRRDCKSFAGTCQISPLTCTDDESPVCGCDGVTYFNDCLRQIAGAPGSYAGECGISGLECNETPDQQCPESSVCALLAPKPSACHGKEGRCWFLPATCPPPSHSDRWTACDDSDADDHCVSTCFAIRQSAPSNTRPNGKWFARASMCD